AAILLGTVTALDPDQSGAFASLVYSVTDPHFEIVNGNELWLKAGQMSDLDFETSPNVNVTVTAKDRDGAAGALSTANTFTFSLTDRDDVLEGGSAGDVLTGQSGRDRLYGFGGD